MDVLTTILITLVVTLLSLVLLVPVAWKSVKYVARAVESIATFLYKLKGSLRAVFKTFKKKSDIKEEAREASKRQQALLSTKHTVVIGEPRMGVYGNAMSIEELKRRISDKDDVEHVLSAKQIADRDKHRSAKMSTDMRRRPFSNPKPRLGEPRHEKI